MALNISTLIPPPPLLPSSLPPTPSLPPFYPPTTVIHPSYVSYRTCTMSLLVPPSALRVANDFVTSPRPGNHPSSPRIGISRAEAITGGTRPFSGVRLKGSGTEGHLLLLAIP